MIEYLFTSLIRLSFVFVISLSFRFILEIFGQKWIRTTSNTATLILLPIVTFVITKVIQGNIALSLGMVGALSIVRFRNPVRSPLELTVYFSAITMGIAASVSLKSTLLLGIAFYISIILLYLIFLISNRFFKREFLISSFSEGNQLCTLEVITSSRINLLDESKSLKSLSYLNNGETEYLLACNDFVVLKELALNLDKNKSVIKYQLNGC